MKTIVAVGVVRDPKVTYSAVKNIAKAHCSSTTTSNVGASSSLQPSTMDVHNDGEAVDELSLFKLIKVSRNFVAV